MKLHSNIELYSFDIFDTLITRKVGIPQGIFAIMQQKIKELDFIPENLKNNFYHIRIQAENNARKQLLKQNNDIEISFDSIYDFIKVNYDIDNDTITYLKDLEIQVEFENVVPIQENIAKIKDLILCNKKVILISDMYHSAQTIRKLLLTIDSVFDDIKIYVSSEYKATKANGTLYKIIQEIERISVSKWQHIGNDLYSDIQQAKKNRISTQYFQFPQLELWEQKLLAKFPTNVSYQYLIGASQITKLNKVLENKDKYNFGVSYTGPVLYNYINNILDAVKEKEVSTIYFVARDGYIPQKIADIIIQKQKLNIKTKYIYGSRLAWRIPNDKNYEHIVTSFLEEYNKILTINLLAYRLHVSSKELGKYLKNDKIRKVLTAKQVEKYRYEFIHNSKLRQYILNENKARLAQVYKYIKQEIDLTQKDLIFVDIQGSGQTQDILAEFINDITPNKTIHSFYIATDNAKQLPYSKKYAFCTYRNSYYYFFELLTRTKDGQTCSYQENNGKMIPITEDVDKSCFDKWGYDTYLSGILDFTKTITNFNIYTSDNELLYHYIEHIITQCDPKTASIIGDIPFLAIGKECNVKKSCPEIPIYKYLFMMLLGQEIKKISDFPFISIARGNFISNFIKLILVNIQKYCNFQDFLTSYKLKKIIKNNKNKKIVFWGASLFLEQFLHKFNTKNFKILGIIDRNTSLHGSKLANYTVYSPDELVTLNPDYVIFTIKNNNQAIYYQVANYLKDKYPQIKLSKNFFTF